MKWVLLGKTFVVFLCMGSLVWYYWEKINLTLINIEEYQNVVFFLNNYQPKSNLLEWMALLFIKFIFNVDLHSLHTFFESLNPMFS